MSEKVDIHVIFGLYDQGTDYEWIGANGAWDEYSIEENNEGYEADIKRIRETADEVRVMVFSVDYDKVRDAFARERTVDAELKGEAR